MSRKIHPIEAESYRRLRRVVDLTHLPPLSRSVAERVIHASADPEYSQTLVLDEDALNRGRDALSDGAPIVSDVRMVAAGITSREVRCFVSDERTLRLASESGLTRSAAGFRVALEEVGAGAVWVIGNAPTALFELIELIELKARPSLVVGLPVGFVGAAESKAALLASGLPCVANVGMKGGSAVASAAVNALLYHDSSPEDAP